MFVFDLIDYHLTNKSVQQILSSLQEIVFCNYKCKIISFLFVKKKMKRVNTF